MHIKCRYCKRDFDELMTYSDMEQCQCPSCGSWNNHSVDELAKEFEETLERIRKNVVR